MQLQQDLYHDQPETHEPADVSEPLPEYAEKFQTLCQTGLEDEMRILSTILLEKLSGKRQIPVRGLESEYQKVHQLIEQTVSVGEGNSMLLLGSRGCGKTAIVESIISSLRKEHSNDFHVVRLNGFLHTDDRLALREMWRQLGREMHTEDDAAKVSSYADTMATLLALLSHPEELFGASGDPGSKTAAKSIVILLDEFDLFVTHPRQTLLYNLFDIAQARKAPIAVIGLTTKVDVTEMLEKRVKSRFSHRYTYVPLPRSFETFSDICLGSLDLSDAEMADIADELGSERTLVESDKWKSLLGGWKEYLKVRSIIFSFIQSVEPVLNHALENSICGMTRNSNSTSGVSTTKPNQQRSFSTARFSPSATCYKAYRSPTRPYPKSQLRKASPLNPLIAPTQHPSLSPHPSHLPVPRHCHWLCW
jgi:origin recognition complex subunit 4